jgi:predicted Zn-dependent protease
MLDSASVLEAMERELRRSLEGLRVPEVPAPYYLAYALRREEQLRLRGAYGALTRDRHARRNRIFVDVRVGDAKFDNVYDGGLNTEATERESADWVEAADHLDPDVLRVAFWKMSEIKFDEAVEDYYDHQKAAVSEYLRDEVDAFSPAPRLEHIETLEDEAFHRETWGELLVLASRRFLGHPEIFDPAIELWVRRAHRYFVDSDGARVVTSDTYVDLRVQGWVLTEDGVYVEGSRSVYGRSVARVPKADELEALVDAVLEDLQALQGAPSPGSFIGPALLAGQAAATILHEALGHRLEGERLVARGETRTFAHKLGERILPAGLDVFDDPTLERVGEQDLWGSYRVDDQGVAAQRVELVRDGCLVGFLQSRSPTPQSSGSNGHGRHDGVEPIMARMGNLMVEARSEGKTWAALMDQLCELARAQGRSHALLIRHVRAGETSTSSYDFQVFKGELAEVYLVDAQTQALQRVRDVELIGTPLSAMQRIVAHGRKLGLDYGSCFAESGAVPVGGAAPPLLLSEVELQQSSSSGFHEPLLPPPFADDGSRGRKGGRHERGRRNPGKDT